MRLSKLSGKKAANRKVRRVLRAEARAAARSSRTAKEQVALLDGRPGSSVRERAKLQEDAAT